MLMIAIVATIVIIVIFALYLLGGNKNEMLLKKKLNQMDDEFDNDVFTGKGSQVVIEMTFIQRTLYPYALRMATFLKKRMPEERLKEIEKNLIVSGNKKGQSASEFLGFQGIYAALFAIIGLFLGINFMGAGGILLALGGAVAGFMLPSMELKKEVKKRQTKVLKDLPYTLDLLNIGVDAGLGFDSAMDRVSMTMDGPLSKEFQIALSEIQLGKSRRDALRNMIERTEVPELNQFIVAVLQAEKLGVGMSKLLKAQSKAMRIAAKQRAQEKAFQAPVKMLFPMVIFVFPSIFVVLLGPGIMSIVEVFASL